MLAIDLEPRIGHRRVRERVRPHDAARVRALEPQLHPTIDRRDNEEPTIIHELGVRTRDFSLQSANATRHRCGLALTPGR